VWLGSEAKKLNEIEEIYLPVGEFFSYISLHAVVFPFLPITKSENSDKNYGKSKWKERQRA